MPLNIIRNDITKVSADAIVNTANPQVAVGAGVDQSIYEAAGAEQLLAERAKIGPMRPGQAAVTPAFALDAKYIIHTVGPAWQGGDFGEREAVASCYRESLRLADELHCESIAFPLISTGTYGFPKDEALRIAINEISSFLFSHDMNVYMVVYSREAFVISSKAFSDIKCYIGDEDVKPPMVYGASRPFGASQSAGQSQSFGTPQSAGQSARERRRRIADALPFRREKKASRVEDISVIINEREAADFNIREEFKSPVEPKAAADLNATMELEFPVEYEAAADFDATMEPEFPRESEFPVEPEAAMEPESAFAAEVREDKMALEEVFDDLSAADMSYIEQDLILESAPVYSGGLEDVLNQKAESFQQMLFRIIDRKGMTDPEVYKKANLDRKLFSKIRSSEEYHPKKKTVLALAVALELNMDETIDLLRRAGIALNPSDRFDLIVGYCISHRIYNIFDINTYLFEYDEPLLGA